MLKPLLIPGCFLILCCANPICAQSVSKRGGERTKQRTENRGSDSGSKKTSNVSEGKSLDKVHEVKKGETLWGIAQEYNKSVGEIMEANHLTHEQVKAGMKLKIPSGTPEEALMATTSSPQTSSKHQTYRVKPKDTFYGIAALHKVTPQQLSEANPKAVPTRLQIGQELIIPRPLEKKVESVKSTPAAKKDEFIKHTVKSGETYFSISKIYGVGISDLMVANPEHKPERLRQGIVLTVPKKSDKSADAVVAEDKTESPVIPKPKYIGRPSTNQTHVVRKGETLMSLTRIYDVSLDELKIANRLTSKDVLKEGDEVIIPPKSKK